MRATVILTAVMVALAACASPRETSSDGATTTSRADPTTSTTTAAPGSTGGSTTTSPPRAASLPLCGETPRPTAPDTWYRDEPRYVGNEMPTDEVRAFASTLPGFQTLWIDRDHNGWITVGFHDTDIEARQAELEAEFPGVGVVAVEMPHSREELEAIRSRVAAALPDDMDASNVDEVSGVVSVWVGELTRERLAQVEEAAGDDPVCVIGVDPDELPPAGPQQPGGDGWRYLGEVDRNIGNDLADSPRIAADQAAWEELWGGIGEGDPPPVDFQVEVAAAVEIGYSGSCPETRLDDVVVDGEVVFPDIVGISRQLACTADYNPRTYFFTVFRDRLPDPPWFVADDPESQRQWLRVDADLSAPGAVPAPDEVSEVPAPQIREATPYPLIVEPGFPWQLTLDLSCGVEQLGEINFYRWRTDTDVVPDAWRAAAEDGLVELELLLEAGSPPTLTLSGHGASLEYSIDDDPGPACG